MKKETIITLVLILVLILIIFSIVFLFVNKKEENTNNIQENEYQSEELNNNEEQEQQESSLEEDKEISQKILEAVNKANSGDKEGALNDYFSILNDDPSNLVVLNNIADLYSDMSNWGKSEEYYKKLLEAHPEYVPGYRMLAYLYQYRFNDDENKIKALIDDGLNKNNNHPDLLSWIVNYYQERGEGEKALPYSSLLTDKLNESGGE